MSPSGLGHFRRLARRCLGGAYFSWDQHERGLTHDVGTNSLDMPLQVACYSIAKVEALIHLYRAIFPRGNEHWPTLATYWDFHRTRPWSHLTTNFHAVNAEDLAAFDLARRSWCPTGLPGEDGVALAAIASAHGCGYSIGISPWTDSALHATVTPETRALIALVGHDWYPIVPKRGPVEARPPLDIFHLLDSTDPQWCRYADGIPSAEDFRRARVGLLFLNLVPDFRPPGAGAEKGFPFPPGLGYQDCRSGLLAALSSAHDFLPILGVITWGSAAWEALRGLVTGPALLMGVAEATCTGGKNGFALASDDHPWRVYPFPHPTPSKRHLLWTQQIIKTYESRWAEFLKTTFPCGAIVPSDPLPLGVQD